MRRWNGWGDEATQYPLPEAAAQYLAGKVDAGHPTPDVAIEKVIQSVPPTRLPAADQVIIEPLDRVLHARGQSLPDWAALRSGDIGFFPDAVAYPASEAEVRDLIQYSDQVGARLIPYGGGTSVVGHITPLSSEHPVMTVDLTRLNNLIALNETDRLATFGAGIRGPALETRLNASGYTLGHYPQSFELSTLGGWVATRSSGQQSFYYGRIEDLFAGGHLESPAGPLDLPVVPASAAGPDLRQIVLGSEGRLGILTQATVRIRPCPPFEQFYGVFFKDWESGVNALRDIAQEPLPLSMARLSDAQETETTLALSGKETLVAIANRGLGWLGFGSSRCLLVFGLTGEIAPARATLSRAQALFRSYGGLFTGQTIGKIWSRSRFLTPYLRNTLWEKGYALDTLETAVPWSRVLVTTGSIQAALRRGLEEWNERVLVFSHLSHIYRDGASIYTTYLFRLGPTPYETIRRWERLKSAASQVIVSCGGTISHQHGVGIDHAPYLPAEKGPLGIKLLEAACQSLDPHGLMNPGKLLR